MKSDFDDSKVEINEVAMRDGLQMEQNFIATADKVRLVNELGHLGFARIEVTSFTSPNAIPMLADAEEVLAQIDRVDGVRYTALIPNMRGAERALDSALDEFALVMSATETHNLCNLRMTRAQSFAAISDVVGFARQHNVDATVALSCAFGCPMEGEVEAEEVLDMVGRFADLGVRGVSLCDTTGMAYPTQVADLCAATMARFPDLDITAHFHNTRGMGLANIVAALGVGIRRFDTSLGGLGGCPYAPGATGNVATDDVVHMLECMGYDTGIALQPLRQAAKHLQTLVGHQLSSQVVRSGHRLVRHEPPDNFHEIRARAEARG